MQGQNRVGGKRTPTSTSLSVSPAGNRRIPQPEPILFEGIPRDINGDLLRPLFALPRPQLVAQVADLMLVSRNWQAAVQDLFLRRQAGDEAGFSLAHFHQGRLVRQGGSAASMLEKVLVPYGCLDFRYSSLLPKELSRSLRSTLSMLETFTCPQVVQLDRFYGSVKLLRPEDVAALAARIRQAGTQGLRMHLEIRLGTGAGQGLAADHLTEVLLQHWVGGGLVVDSCEDFEPVRQLFSRLVSKLDGRGRRITGLKKMRWFREMCCLVLPPLVKGVARPVFFIDDVVRDLPLGPMPGSVFAPPPTAAPEVQRGPGITKYVDWNLLRREDVRRQGLKAWLSAWLPQDLDALELCFEKDDFDEPAWILASVLSSLASFAGLTMLVIGGWDRLDGKSVTSLMSILAQLPGLRVLSIKCGIDATSARSLFEAAALQRGLRALELNISKPPVATYAIREWLAPLCAGVEGESLQVRWNGHAIQVERGWKRPALQAAVIAMLEAEAEEEDARSSAWPAMPQWLAHFTGSGAQQAGAESDERVDSSDNA